MLRLLANGQTGYITLGSRDSDVEICCATKPRRLVKEPFTYTEAEAYTKLSAQREKSDSNLNVKDSADDSPEISVGDPSVEKTGSKSTQDPPESPFANSEAEAVRCLRDRGYIVAPPPRTSTSDLGSITLPPPYSRHLSSSQPVQSIARFTDVTVTSTNKRKRSDDGRGDSLGSRNTGRANSCPSTPTGRFVMVGILAQTGGMNAESREIESSDANPNGATAATTDDEGDEDDEVVSAPQRKRHRTTRISRTELL